jgi:cation diffusion facilitator family transporter
MRVPGSRLHAVPSIDATVRSEAEQRQATRSTWVSVWVNVLLSTAQIAIGLFARSQALIADGIHSLSDLLADVVVLVAARHSNVRADDNHQYGHARFETAASLAIGAILLATGAAMAWNAGLKLHAGTAQDAVHPAALFVALATLLCKEILFRYMRRVGERLQSSMLIANAWHARADAASSLVVALGIVANLAGYHSMDAVAAAIVGFMIAKAGWEFSVEAFHGLTDHALDAEETARILQTVNAVDGVRDVHGLRTRRMGDWAVIDMHIAVDSRISVSEGHFIAETINARVRGAHRVAECTVHVDPLDARDLSVVLALPPRREILAVIEAALPGARDIRLQYLDTGLEVDIDAVRPLGPAQTTRAEDAVRAGLLALAGVNVASVRVRPAD